MDVHDPKVLKARLEQLAVELPNEVTSRPMMGGFIGYADGRTFVSISTGGLGVKLLPADQERALARPGAVWMRHSPEEPESKSYITFSEVDTVDDEFMIEWLLLAATTAPAKKKG
jgi:TfoX/Sxy family transcriptional regulator of competence genes